MGKNLKKFANPRFIRTIDLSLLRRLLERHERARTALDLSMLDRDTAAARDALYRFFTGPDENYPEGLVADLHRIAELGDAEGLRLLLELAERRGIVVAPARDADGGENRQEPKHVAILMFLDHSAVFDAASDMLAMTARSSLAEYAGIDEGVEPELSDATKAAFEAAAAKVFHADLRGSYCRIGWYDDADEITLVVTHGSLITTTPVVDGGAERVISFRAAEHAVLSYAASNGRLKIGGVPKARRAEVAELFATTMLGRPGFFASHDAQHLYTLAPIERVGCGFGFNHGFDPGIRQVEIVEAQIDELRMDARTGEMHLLRSFVTRDRNDNALAQLPVIMRSRSFGPNWRLDHIVIRVHVDLGAAKPSKVTVKIKPPASAIFKRHRFEDRIMTLLHRNGLLHDREPGRAAHAAE